MDTIEKIVIKGSDTTYILKDSNALPSTNVTQDIDENSTAEQVPSAKAVYQMGGSGGEAAGFGTPEASATQLESTQPPTVTVEASGPNTAKIFKFSFGIPQGAKGEKGDTGAQGPKGDTGPQGPAGSDASVTAENIESALGYTPLQENDIVTETSEVLPDYTNQIPLSIDASGAVLNGVGYQASATLDMTGAVASGSSFVSGFIPVKKGDVIRVKDPSSTTFSTGLVFALYKADKATGSNIGRYINTMQANSLYGAVTISGNTLTWDTSSIGYYFWNDFAFLRVTTNSAASIVTVNEEITETTQVVKTLNSNIKVGKNNLNFDFNAALLADKKIVIFGDSIIGATRDQTSVPAYAAAYTGATIYNVGFGGCRMSVHPTAGYAAFSMWALADAIATNTWTTQDAQASSGADYFPEQLALLKSIDFSTVDEIVIHYGTNDFAANVQIDNGSNTTSTSTVCGALRYSIQKILGAYPKIKIFVSLPIYRMWNSVGAETYTNGLGKKLPEYNAAMQTVAESYNLPAIDGYGKLGINSLNDSAYSSDGTHLNDLGRQIFGQLIGGCLISGEGSPSGGDAPVQSVNGSTGAIKTTSKFNATATDNSFTPSFSAGDATSASEQGYMCVLNIQGEFPVLPDGSSTTMSFYLMPTVLANTVELWGGSFVNPFTGAVVVMTYGFNDGSTVALYKTITTDS